MPVFTTDQDFINYEENETLPLAAYSSLLLSINRNHDLRTYSKRNELTCRLCLQDLSFLTYTRQIECSAKQERKKGRKKKAGLSRSLSASDRTNPEPCGFTLQPG